MTGDELSSIKSEFGSLDGNNVAGKKKKTAEVMSPQIALLTAHDTSKEEEDDQLEFFLNNLRDNEDSQK